MSCAGTGDCHGGRARCKTPLTCSGLDADEAIERFRLHRPPMPIRATRWATTQGTLADHIPRVNVIARCFQIAIVLALAGGMAAAIHYF